MVCQGNNDHAARGSRFLRAAKMYQDHLFYPIIFFAGVLLTIPTIEIAASQSNPRIGWTEFFYQKKKLYLRANKNGLL